MPMPAFIADASGEQQVVCVTESGEDVIWEEAQRAIGVQVAALDELRSRTGLLLAASSLSASFLGSAAATHGVELGFVGGVAIIAFAFAIGSCIKVLFPKRDAWTFVTSPTTLAEDWIDIDRGGIQPMKRFIAVELEDYFNDNKKLIDGLYGWFRLAAIAVGAEVILGCIQLAM